MSDTLKFSSWLSLFVTVFLCIAVTMLAFVFLEEMIVIPAMRQANDRMTNTLPAFIATANQKALVSNDIVSLRSTLDQTMANSSGSGLRYIFMEDADGKIMAEAYSEDMVKADQRRIVHELQTLYGNRGAAESKKDQQEKTSLEKLEEETRGGAGSETRVAITSTEALPPIESRASWQFTSFTPTLVDYTVPVTMGSMHFGGVRIGVVDEITPVIKKIRAITYGAGLVILILAEFTVVYVSKGLDQRAKTITSAAIDTMKKDLEQRIKQLETEHMRQEEDNPISPSEFLALLDFARKVSGSLDYNEVLGIAVHASLQVMNVRDVSIFTLDNQANELVGRIGHDENGFMDDAEMAKVRVPVGKGDIGTAAEFGTTTTIDTPKPGSAIVSALASRGRTIGVMIVRNKLNGRPFLKKDQTMVRIFAGILGNAMENTAVFHHMSAGR